MKKEIIWVFFYSMTAILATFLLLQTGSKIFFYLRVSEEKEAKVTKWTLSSHKEKKFYLTAFYTFSYA